MPVSPSVESRHASWWQLCLAFVLALLLFLMLRWQPEPWLRQQIDQQARQNGIDLQYRQLDIEGMSVRMEHVSIQTAALPMPVVLDSLSFTPVWALLSAGTAAVEVHASVLAQPVKAVLVWQENHMQVRELNADLDVAVLQPLWKQYMILPVDVGGRLKLTGNVQLDAANGRPVEGQLEAIWKQASIDLPMFDKSLGDYQLALKATDNSGRWQWSLGGGTQVMLSGAGQLDMSEELAQQWAINGRVQLQAAPEASSIAAMLGGQAKAFSISGNLLNARIQPLPH